MNQLPQGVFPVMITPFTETNEIDYTALEQLIEWYIGKGVQGLFAVCLSSEMYKLSLRERVELARFTVEKADGRVPVVASGHVSDSIPDQLEEIGAIAAAGVDAVVLVTNRLAGQEEDDEVWKRNCQLILDRYPDTDFGLYECPVPYQRLLSPKLLQWCADTGRFTFLKECSNNLEQIKGKLQAVQGSRLQVYIANNPHLLETMQLGGSGYSGILANFQPDLYSWLTDNWDKEPEKAQLLQSYLGASCLFEGRHYPTSAKYYVQLEGLKIHLHSRTQQQSNFRVTHQREIEQLHRFNGFVSDQLLSES